MVFQQALENGSQAPNFLLAPEAKAEIDHLAKKVQLPGMLRSNDKHEVTNLFKREEKKDINGVQHRNFFVEKR